MKICDRCPCLNHDYENGSWCNLDYDLEYVELGTGKWHTISKNCKLLKIVTEDEEFYPTKVY